MGASLGVHRRAATEVSAAIRSRLLEHRLRAVHAGSRRSRQSKIRALGRPETGMRDTHIFGALAMMHLLLGFVIALCVGLTGIGGGSFTVPALLLIVGLPAGEAVGTAFVFAGVLRLGAAPFY